MGETDLRPAARSGLIVAALAAVVFLALAVALVPWEWIPGQRVTPVDASSVFTADQIDRAEDVSWMQRLPSWGNIALGLVASLWLGFSRTGSRLLARLPGPWWVRVVIGSGVITGAGALVRIPLAARIQEVRRDAGLSVQEWGSWALDQVIGFLVAWVFAAIALVVLVAVIRKAPRTWPVWAAAAAASLAFAGSFVYPVVVEPLFNNFSSLPAGDLRTEIFALAEKEKVPIDDVLVADASRRTTTLNAYVSGFGSTRRVVLYDNLLTGLPQPEIEVIVAHELGHAQHRDVLIGTTLGAVGAAIGVGLLGWLLTRPWLLRRCGAQGPGDPRLVGAVLALSAVGALVASPVQNTISRAVEARADRTSLEATGETATFISMQRQLTLRSLNDPTPPRVSHFWFGSHPTVLYRIGLANQVAQLAEQR